MGNNKLFLYWEEHSLTNFHVLLGVVAIAAQVIGKLSGNGMLPAFGDGVGLFCLFHFLIHSYFHRQQNFLVNHQRTYSLPRKKIARTGGRMLAAFLVAVSVAIAFIREFYKGTLLGKLKTFFLYLLSKLLGTIVNSDGLGRDKLSFRDKGLLEAMNDAGAVTDSSWEYWVEKLQSVLVVLGIILLIAIGIGCLIGQIRKLAGHTTDHIRHSEGYETDDIESAIRSFSDTAKLRRTDFSADARIRRHYRKNILKRKGRNDVIPDSLTPEEIETYVAAKGKDRKAMHELYEKARYSAQGCTENDVRSMKGLNL